MKYGEDEALWASPIAQCLQGEMGMSIEYIEKWKLIEWISALLNADEPGPEEELTERPAIDQVEGSAAAFEGAYHFVAPVNEQASTGL